jgi:hypothetical protein
MKDASILNLAISDASVRWNQEPHCEFEDKMDKDIPNVEMKAVSNGVAKYLVLSSFEFAISDEEELKAFIRMLRDFMDTYCGEDKEKVS